MHEYQDLFPHLVVEMNGIKGKIGEMKVFLRLDAQRVKDRPYRLNPRVEEKVKREIDKMLDVGIIFLVDEAEWISLIVIQNRKDATKIRVCVDYRSLNNACMHNPFPMPFRNEVLDNVAGSEAYSFTNGFLGYHQVKID